MTARVFKISFRMITPICLGGPWMHFDGLLAHLELRKKMCDEYYNLPSNTPLELDIQLPLRKIFYAPNKYFYDASVSFIDGKLYPYDAVAVAGFRKRIYEQKIHEVETKKKKIETAKGPFKLYDMKLPYFPCREVSFLVAAKDKSWLEELLGFAASLGKKRSAGFGFVSSVKIEPAELDKAFILSDGTVTRPIPLSAIDMDATLKAHGTLKPIPQAVRTPYWDRQNVEVCVAPGSKVVPRDDLREE